MASFNFSTRQMAAKIVYYGPGLCGKTTSLKYVFDHTSSDARGKMVSLATETDRTLFFDLLPLEVGAVAGFHTRIQLYTVPGQVFYNSTRRLVLKGVDGVVFVADSQPAMLPANVESFRNLEVNLDELGISVDEIPLVLQYNKRDLDDICSVQELSEALNRNGWPSFESSAITGSGIFETLREISKRTLLSLKRQLESDESSSALLLPAEPSTIGMDQDTPAAAGPPSAPAPAPPPAAPPPPPPAPSPRAELVEADKVAAAKTATAPPAKAAPPPEKKAAPAAKPAAPPKAPAIEAPKRAQSPPPPKAAKPEPSLEKLAATNGHSELGRSVAVEMEQESLIRARKISVDLQIRDDKERVLHQVRDLEWKIEDQGNPDEILLQLQIALNAKSLPE